MIAFALAIDRGTEQFWGPRETWRANAGPREAMEFPRRCRGDGGNWSMVEIDDGDDGSDHW